MEVVIYDVEGDEIERKTFDTIKEVDSYIDNERCRMLVYHPEVFESGWKCYFRVNSGPEHCLEDENWEPYLKWKAAVSRNPLQVEKELHDEETVRDNLTKKLLVTNEKIKALKKELKNVGITL